VDEAVAVIAYPFFDNMEDPALSKENWVASSWTLVSPGADGSEFCWEGDGLPHHAAWNTLTLANVVDLSAAQHPQLTFRHRFHDAWNRFHVQVSDSYGHGGTWQTLAVYDGDQNDWTRSQIDLSAFQGLPHVRIRFVCNANYPQEWYAQRHSGRLNLAGFCRSGSYTRWVVWYNQ
jgi:hypothetical protein